MGGTGQTDEYRTKGSRASWQVWGQEVPGPQDRQREVPEPTRPLPRASRCSWRWAACQWCQRSPRQSSPSGSPPCRTLSASSECRGTRGLGAGVGGISPAHPPHRLPFPTPTLPPLDPSPSRASRLGGDCGPFTLIKPGTGFFKGAETGAPCAQAGWQGWCQKPPGPRGSLGHSCGRPHCARAPAPCLTGGEAGPLVAAGELDVEVGHQGVHVVVPLHLQAEGGGEGQVFHLDRVDVHLLWEKPHEPPSLTSGPAVKPGGPCWIPCSPNPNPNSDMSTS